MIQPKDGRLVFLIVGLALIAPVVAAQQDKQAEREAMYYRYLEFASYVKGGSLEPHWMADGSSFWYAEGAPENTVIWKIDPVPNTKAPLFDTARLRKALRPLLGHEPPYQGLPFREFVFIDGEKAVIFTVEEKEFILQLDSYTVTRLPAVSEEEKNRTRPKGEEVPSPDGRWLAGVKDHNIWLRSTSEKEAVQLTDGGLEDYEWGHDIWNRWLHWSPDSSKLATSKIDLRHYPKIPVVQYLKPREEESLEWKNVYDPRAGEHIPQTELYIVDSFSKQHVRVETGEEPHYFLYPHPGWRPDGSELIFWKMSRDFKKLELLATNPQTGATRIILTETQKTFLFGTESVYKKLFTWLPDGKRFLLLSERDGWRHLYLYHVDGTLIRQLTPGAFPVIEVVAVDEKSGWVYFTAHGDPQRLYDTHLYRVNLEGQGFTRLTEAEGQHGIQFAPSKEFYLDTHSSVDRPPVVELRRADGTLVQILSKANIDALKELHWKPPEEFVVKAADGKTDLYGVLYKPYDFDLNKKYPVVEVIDAGPWLAMVPHTFMLDDTPLGNQRAQAIAQLGFIVFTVDGRGTPERGKAFQDVVYGNIGRIEIPDHVATLKQLAEKRSYMDLSRVGIYGHSWGGYFATRALLLAPDVYHVGVASAAPADMDRDSVYMGPAQNNKEGYEYASNLRLAGNLKGKLLLIHGTSDEGFSNTMKMVDALIRAGKPYDLMVMPGVGHRIRNMPPYWRQKWGETIRRYFQEHLKP